MIYGFNDKKEKVPFIILEKKVTINSGSGVIPFIFDETELSAVGINSDVELKKYIVLSSMQTYGDNDTYWYRPGGAGQANHYPDVSIHALSSNYYRVEGYVYFNGDYTTNRVRIVLMRIE